MTVHYRDDAVTLHHGDCLDVLRELPGDSVDAVVTDPPYGIRFMGKAWDGDDIVRGIEVRRSQAPMPDGGKAGRNGGYQSPAAEAGRYDQSVSGNQAFQAWCTDWAAECLRILKPGGYLLSFGGSRTWHRLAAAVEDAGFEIRDSIAWLYGSGFPKSLDVSKAIDKRRDDKPEARQVGAWLREQREAAGLTHAQVCARGGWHGAVNHGGASVNWERGHGVPTWEQWLALQEMLGFGSELDAEVWRLNGRKGTPGEAWDEREVVGSGYRVRRESTVQIVGLSDGEYDITAPATEAAQQWQGWGTALKPAFEPIVIARKPFPGTVAANVLEHGTGALNIDACRTAAADPVVTFDRQAGDRSRENWRTGGAVPDTRSVSGVGRWPTNVVLDESQAAELDKQTGVLTSGYMKPETDRKTRQGDTYGDSGGASRFFPTFRYEAKAPTSERPRDGEIAHPTVKPLDLMCWLVRLVTPPGGTVLEPFAGSGTTAEACVIEGFKCIAIEREADYLPLIVNRLSKPIQIGLDFEGGAA